MLRRMLDQNSPASRQAGVYPRPQLVRTAWVDLTGEWRFDFDDDPSPRPGLVRSASSLGRSIRVPFPPESPASGIGDPGYHHVMWYSRTVTAADLDAAGHCDDRQLVVHFGAVDHRADVWVDGHHVAHHEGGHTPFTAHIPGPTAGFELTVRAEDDPTDLTQPRGKQDWQRERHVIWYDRTSGIWQPVWLESVPRQHIEHLTWLPDVPSGTVTLEVELAEAPATGTELQVQLRLHGELLAAQTTVLTTRCSQAVVTLPRLRNGQALDDLLWTPESPTLLDATLAVSAPGQPNDSVTSYFGLRTVSVDADHLTLNSRPYPVRAVLSQGYWPDSHLAAPSPEALRAEVQLVKDLGFNTVRVHQKSEDPRFLYWADRLGVLVWDEMPSTYEFSPAATARLTAEWIEIVRRDRSHPSVVAWVPFNESWGVHDLATSPTQQHLVRSIYELTKSLDDTRLVISNDGWEHLRSDLFTVHDYETDAERLFARYEDADTVARTLSGVAPHGRRMLVGSPDETAATASKPVILSEFGGVAVAATETDAWGYGVVDLENFEPRLTALFTAVREAKGLAGWCYTQLTDTAQEANGLVDAHRIPKLPVDVIRRIVLGEWRPRPAQPIFAADGHRGEASGA
jgi:beta-galactosidase/beta-glucuronidase